MLAPPSCPCSGTPVQPYVLPTAAPSGYVPTAADETSGGGPVPASAIPSTGVPSTGGPSIAIPATITDPQLRDLIASEAASPTASSVIQRALQTGVTVNVIPDAEADAIAGPKIMGQYDPGTDTVWLRRSLMTGTNRRQGLQTLAHEMLHVIDRKDPRHQQMLEQLDASYRAAGLVDPAARAEQVRYHGSIVRESRAYVYQAQVRRELGIEPTSDFHRRVQEAPTEYEAYRIAWSQMTASRSLDRPIAQRDVPLTFMPGNTPADPV